MVIDDAPTVEFSVGRQRREAVVVTSKSDLTNLSSRSLTFPAKRASGHVAELQFTSGDRDVALISLSGVNPFAGAGKNLSVMDFTPAAQTLTVWLELRVHRPDLLFARTAHEDHGNIAKDQPSGGHRRILRIFEGHERLQESESRAVVGVGTHLAGLPND